MYLVTNAYDSEKENTFKYNFDSEILSSTDKVDLIINGICKREEKKQKQVCVDEQITFFMYFAFMLRGSVPKLEFKKILLEILENINQENINAFLAHPLLKTTKDHIVFKYDFLKDHFRFLKISTFFESDVDIPDELITSLASESGYNSSLVEECAKRVFTKCNDNEEKWEDFLFYISRIIDTLSLRLENASYRRNIQKAISALIAISLKSYHRKYGKTMNLNTSLIKNLLGETNIKNLFIFDNLNGEKIIFDFSNMKVSNSGFIDYDCFFECKFNEDTFFDQSCTIRNLYTDRPNKSTAKGSNFDKDMKDTDESIINFVRAQKGNRQDLNKKTAETIEIIFEFFYQNGIFKLCSVEVLKQKYERRTKINFPYIDMIDFLKDMEVVAWTNKKQYDAYE